MTQEEKKLLIKDLCSRLPYDTVIHYHWEKKGTNAIVDVDRELDFSDVDSLKYTLTDPQDDWCIIDWKPYLRPMSSMTEEEKYYYFRCIDEVDGYKITVTVIYQDKALELLDWLNAHHFDYRGLIEKGLALEAREGMYKM